MTFNTHRQLDEKFDIIHEIKKGGFGIVYYGVDKKLNKPVAIKEIAPNLLDDAKYLDMFQEEALNIAKLSHNNIVHIYELKKMANGHLFIIMEYIDGVDLEKVIRNAKRNGNALPPHLAVYIVAEICMALDYAHQRRDTFTNKPLNLVHQDISPSNIMLSRYGGVKLIDFGIATVRRHRKSKKDNKLRGKIPYMAPEQLIMGNHPDHRSDLFSLGLVLFESLTGDRLFQSQEEVIAAGRNSKWFKRVMKGRKLPGPLSKVLAKALEIDISKRYQSANHMYIDLLQYLISANETGELSDNLAEYVADQISQPQPIPETPSYRGDQSDTASSYYSPNKTPDLHSPHTYTPNYNPTPGRTSSGFTPNRWVDPNPVPQREPAPHDDEPMMTSDIDRQFHTLNTMELPGDEDELKTVIDVIRVSARHHKRRIMQGIIGFLMVFVALGILDTINGWTNFGIWMYDFLFPPAIKVLTVPDNASLMLDGSPVDGRTPLAIDKISPGVHKLELQHAGFKPIVKSLFVPREGDVRIQGEANNPADRRYLFRFSTEITVDSDPPNAQVYINGIRYNQNTPCTVLWEVGSPFELELEIPGFQRLRGYTLDTAAGYDEVEDRRFWQLQVSHDDYKTYNVTGIFRKKVVFNTTPSEAQIVDTKSNKVIGISGSENPVFLTSGSHVLELQKKNFIPQTVTITIDKDFDDRVQAVLSRRVRFTAVDALGTNGRDIGATIISLQAGKRELLRQRRRTPFELTLPAYSLTAVLDRPGFEQASVKIGPGANSVRVEMEPAKAVVEINVLDAVTGRAIRGADIYFNLANSPQTRATLLDRTDARGEAFGQVAAGSYQLRVSKVGYSSVERTLAAGSGQSQSLTFRLYPTN